MYQCEIAIVGSGISGLGLAHFCAKTGHDVCLFEREPRLGGAIQTKRTNNFWFELGGHTCYNSYQTLIEMLYDLDIIDSIQSRSSKPFPIWFKGKFHSIFSQINLVELIFHAPHLFWLKKEGETVSSYYSRIFGKRNFAQTFSSVFSAVSSQQADQFPANLLFKKRPRDNKFPKSFTFINGLQSIVESIISHQNIDYKTSCEIESISREPYGYSIKTADGIRYFAKRLALATPPPVAANLLKEIWPELAQHLAKLSFVKVESMGIAVEAAKLKTKPIAGAIARDEAFFSIVSRDVVPNNDFRAFTFHFAPDTLNYHEKIERIKEVINIEEESMSIVYEATHTLPSLRLGHDNWVIYADQLLQKTDLLLTGNYFSGISIEDCLFRSKQQASRLLDN